MPSLRKFFGDIARGLGLWDKSGRVIPPSVPQPTPSRPNTGLPPFLQVGGKSSEFDDEVRWLPKSPKNPAHYKVGDERGSGPSMDGIESIFNVAPDDDGFYTIIIGGDAVEGDTGSLGNPDTGPVYRGYKVQKGDLESWLEEAENADDFASLVSPPGHGWHGVRTIEVKDTSKE